MTDCRGYLAAKLRTDGYDGLYNAGAECACGNDDLMPCCESFADCQPAYLWKCEHCEIAASDDGCEFEGAHCYRDRKQGPTTCPHCGCGTFFGPSGVTLHGQEHEYVSCKRCGSLLVVGRDVVPQVVTP